MWAFTHRTEVHSCLLGCASPSKQEQEVTVAQSPAAAADNIAQKEMAYLLADGKQ